MRIPGAPLFGESDNNAEDGLLPPWATDAQVAYMTEQLVMEITNVTNFIDRVVKSGGQTIILEAEALLEHEANGW